MRKDMAYIGGNIRSLEVLGPRKLNTRGMPQDLETLPVRQSMRSSVPHYSYPRVISLNPIKRWLRQQVGRAWDDVYAELRNQFDTRNIRQGRVLESILNHIDLKVYVDDDGTPRVSGAYGYCYAVTGLYVHPNSGLICEPKPAPASRKVQVAQYKSSPRIEVSNTLQLHLLDELWFWVELAPITSQNSQNQLVTDTHLFWPPENVSYDTILCQPVVKASQQQFKLYGRPDVYAKRKWQASKRDIDRYVKIAA